MRARTCRGRSNRGWTIGLKLFVVLRFIFSIVRPCPDSRFSLGDATIPSFPCWGPLVFPFFLVRSMSFDPLYLLTYMLDR